MSNTANAGSSSGLIPFVIGATGHRDLRPSDVRTLKQKVTEVLGPLKRRMTTTPILLLTGLAEGSDQLIAEVALSLNISLFVVLPMPLEIYLYTMSEDAREQFQKLNDAASIKINLPLNGDAPELLASSEDARTKRYSELAMFLANHSQALIALWDGMGGKSGGTAEVVRFVRNGPPRHSGAKGRPPRGTVYHIVTPRQRHSTRIDNAFALLTQADGTQSRSESASAACSLEENIERFNSDAGRLKPDDPLLESLIPKAQQAEAWPYLKRISNCYSYANALAIKYQRRRHHYLWAILGFSFIGFAGLEVHADILHCMRGLWLIYPISILFAVVAYIVSKAIRIENRFHESRGLAEALRIQFYWELAGVHEAVSNYYVFHDPSQIGWILAATRGLTLYCQEPPKPTPSQEYDSLRTTLWHWIVNQARWFGRSSRKQHRAVERLERISNITLIGLLAFSALVAFIALSPQEWHPWWAGEINKEVHEKIHFFIVLPSIALGLLKIWIEQASYDEQARNYRRMSLLFRFGASDLRDSLKAGNMQKAIATIKDLGIKALEENSIWLVMHRERRLKVSPGG
jgi:hypothetical protein